MIRPYLCSLNLRPKMTGGREIVILRVMACQSCLKIVITTIIRHNVTVNPLLFRRTIQNKVYNQ